MINLLKRNDLEVVKYKFILIYIVNILDVIVTMFLLKTGNFYEGNILMKTATEKQLKISKILVNYCVVFYCDINLFQIICSVLYLLGYL